MKLYYDDTRHILAIPGDASTVVAKVHLRRLGGAWNRPLPGHWCFPPTVHHRNSLVDILHAEEDDTARSFMIHEISRLRYLHDARELNVNGHVPVTPRDRPSPFDHQVTGTAALIHARRMLLGDTMGLGKTKEAIDAACYLMSNGQERRVIVISPNSVKLNWGDEIAMHGWGDQVVHIPIGSTKERSEALKTWAARDLRWRSWLILNYEALRFFPLEFLEAAKDSIVICDEAHRLKNPKAKVTKILHQARPSRLWLLTGTPVANRMEDLWSLMHLCAPGIAGWTFWDFSKRHIIRAPNNMIVGYREKEVIKEKLANIAVQRKKEDCLDLPDKIFTRMPVELSPQEQRAYEQMRDEMKAWLENELGEREPTTAEAKWFTDKLIRLRQIADGFVSSGVGGTLDWVRRPTKIATMLESFEDSGKTHAVVWCQFVPLVEKIAECGSPRTYAVYGKIPIGERKAIIEEWEREGGLLIGQMDTMGEGLNLHRADLQYFIDVPWTPKQRLQCVDRLHRIGQKRNVEIVDVLARGTVDERLLDRLDWKIQAADEVTALTRKQMMNLIS